MVDSVISSQGVKEVSSSRNLACPITQAWNLLQAERKFCQENITSLVSNISGKWARNLKPVKTVNRNVYPFPNERVLPPQPPNTLMLSLDTSQAALWTDAYPGFRSMKRLGVFLLPLDGTLVHHRKETIKFAGTHLYTWVERRTVRTQHNIPD